MLDFTGVQALTFDCYGTLIDWETGLLAALRPCLGPNASHLPDEALLNLYARLEAKSERHDYLSYRLILRDVLRRMAGMFNAPVHNPDALADSIRHWPAFPDTAASLAALKSRFRLCIVSNIDDDLFEMSRPQLGAALDEVITAQQVESYKPRKAHFREALIRLGLQTHQVVHVAQSLYHDIDPARELGLKTIWINRQAGRPGATPPTQATPDLELPDMASLARMCLKTERPA